VTRHLRNARHRLDALYLLSSSLCMAAESAMPVRALWGGSTSIYYHDQPKVCAEWLTDSDECRRLQPWSGAAAPAPTPICGPTFGPNTVSRLAIPSSRESPCHRMTLWCYRYRLSLSTGRKETSMTDRWNRYY
jgi:hypothetical protein